VCICDKWRRGWYIFFRPPLFQNFLNRHWFSIFDIFHLRRAVNLKWKNTLWLKIFRRHSGFFLLNISWNIFWYFQRLSLINMSRPRDQGHLISYSPTYTRLVTSRHDTTRHDTFDVSSPYNLAVSSLSNSTAWHIRHDELDSLDTLDALDMTSAPGATRNLVCCVICIKLFTNLLGYTFISFISFDETNRICTCKRINDKTCTSEHYSLLVVRDVGTSTARRARHVERVESCRNVTWRAKLDMGLSIRFLNEYK